MGVQTLAHMEPSSQASKVVEMETIETPTSGLRTKTIIRNESRTRPVQKFGTHKSSFKSNTSAVNRCGHILIFVQGGCGNGETALRLTALQTALVCWLPSP